MQVDTKLKALSEEIDKLKERANTVISSPMELKKYPKYTDKRYIWARHLNSFGTFNLNKDLYFKESNCSWSPPVYTEASLEEALDVFDSAKDLWIQDSAPILEENERIILHNKKQYDAAVSMMKVLGINVTYNTYKGVRMTKKTHTAGFVGDLGRVIPLEDNYQRMLKGIEAQRDSIVAFGRKKIKETEDAEAKEEKERQKREEQVILATLRVKYLSDNLTASADAILDEILSTDPYLKLAHAMISTRNDWSEGFYRIEDVLQCPCVQDTVRADIYKEIAALVEEDDGRVFRDCEFNYDKLFQDFVNKDTYKDYQILVSITQDHQGGYYENYQH